MADLHSLCRNGVHAFDAVLASKSPPEKDLLAEATRCTSQVRDLLMEKTRAGEVGAATLLVKANQLVSELAAAEFPLVGVRRKRIEEARKTFLSLLEDAGT
jgi:hypothetical protein